MSYEETLEYLRSFIDYERIPSFTYPDALKINRMIALCRGLKNPHQNFRSILVAGSKGKGSTSAMIASILQESGLRVGLYTSPHLNDFRERIRVQNKMIEESEVVGLVREIREVLTGDSWKANKPTFFEVYTALAFLYFKEQRVDAAVLEVGLGGLYDATNVVSPEISCITPISLEHTDKLGKTLSEIARQKAGVLRPQGTAVTAPQKEEAREVIAGYCRLNNTKLWEVGKGIFSRLLDFNKARQRFSLMSPLGSLEGLELPLLGDHQIINACTAVTASQLFAQKVGRNLSEEALRAGLQKVRWPGRFEILSNEPDVVVDGAQNKASAEALHSALKKYFGESKKYFLILGVSLDKDLQGIAQSLFPNACEVILTQSRSPRSRPVEDMYDSLLVFGRSLTKTNTAKEAFSYVLEKADKDDLIVVTGSLYLVAEVRELLIHEILFK